MPTTYVSRFLGHRNLATTTRYLNPMTQHLPRAVEKRDEERCHAEVLAGSLQAAPVPAEQTPAHDETQPEATSLIS